MLCYLAVQQEPCWPHSTVVATHTQHYTLKWMAEHRKMADPSCSSPRHAPGPLPGALPGAPLPPPPSCPSSAPRGSSGSRCLPSRSARYSEHSSVDRTEPCAMPRHWRYQRRPTRSRWPVRCCCSSSRMCCAGAVRCGSCGRGGAGSLSGCVVCRACCCSWHAQPAQPCQMHSAWLSGTTVPAPQARASQYQHHSTSTTVPALQVQFSTSTVPLCGAGLEVLCGAATHQVHQRNGSWWCAARWPIATSFWCNLRWTLCCGCALHSMHRCWHPHLHCSVVLVISVLISVLITEHGHDVHHLARDM
jgi:hypothetical protein